jgi:hypothetical protein
MGRKRRLTDMNSIQKNALLSVVTLVFAGLVLLGNQSDSAMTDIPWWFIGGLGVVTLVFALLQRRRKAAPPPIEAPAAKKKSRKR